MSEVIVTINYRCLLKRSLKLSGRKTEIKNRQWLAYLAVVLASCRRKQQAKNTTLLGAIFNTCHLEKVHRLVYNATSATLDTEIEARHGRSPMEMDKLLDR